MKDKKLKSRYLVAIYLIVASFAVICFVIAITSKEGVWQSFLMNLTTELLGVVIIFFLVNRFFLLDEWQISERIDKLLNRLEENDSFSAERFFKPIPNLEDAIQKAQNIDWCGVTLEEEIHLNLPKLKENIILGANVRILIANPSSKALEMSALRSEGSELERFKQKLDASLTDMNYLHTSLNNLGKGKVNGSLSVKLLSYAPSFGMFSFDGKMPDGVIYVEIYGHAGGFGSFPKFELNPQKDGKWFIFFVTQFDEMWQVAKPWTPSVELKHQHDKSSKESN